jgi:hypothetical protein
MATTPLFSTPQASTRRAPSAVRSRRHDTSPSVKSSMSAFLKSCAKTRWFRWSLAGLISLLAAVLFLPGPVGGCYWELGDYFNSTSGHSFSYLADGHAFTCREYSDKAPEWGTYKYEGGVGWVLTLRKSHRRALMKPHLLFITFSDIDAGDLPVTGPFQWRYPFVWKTSAVLGRVTLGPPTNGATAFPSAR